MSDIKGHKFSQTGSSNFSKIVENIKVKSLRQMIGMKM